MEVDGMSMIRFWALMSAGKIVAQKSMLEAGEAKTLINPSFYNLAFLLIRGDGSPDVRVKIAVGGVNYEIPGNQQYIEIFVMSPLRVEAVNQGTSPAEHPSLELAWLLWPRE